MPDAPKKDAEKQEKVPENPDLDATSSAAQNAGLASLLQQLQFQSATSSDVPTPAPPKEHRFWNTQPVPKADEVIEEDGPIEPNVPVDQIRQNPYNLPEGYEWCVIDLNSKEEMHELFDLLSQHYVEDDESMFRFEYTKEFLAWALMPPGWKSTWSVGIRVTSNKKLLAFISGVPVHLRVHKREMHIVEINFLCIHKKLRSKRLAPVMIREITRRVNMLGIFQAVYTAGVVLPKPITTARYFHRSLNPKKLIETGFSMLPMDTTMQRYQLQLKLPAKTSTPGLRPMVRADVPAVRCLVNTFLEARCEIAPVFASDKLAAHWLLPVKDVLYSYVVEDPKTHKITDFVSFYSLPSSVLGHPTHSSVKVAYLYYYAYTLPQPDEANDTAGPAIPERPIDHQASKTRLQSIIKDSLILARDAQFDVVNCLEICDNASFLHDLKFTRGDGALNYYLFNWRCRTIPGDRVGFVML